MRTFGLLAAFIGVFAAPRPPTSFVSSFYGSLPALLPTPVLSGEAGVNDVTTAAAVASDPPINL
jgi:hypothetical protein